MSPTPLTFTPPSAPAGYSWEATNEEVAARYGVPIESIVRFDLNTAPTPPDFIWAFLAAGQFETTLSEYPPADYRRLIEAAAARYGVATDEILVGAGADEILDDIAKAYLGPGATAIVPIPTYAMFRVLTEQRGATVVAVPRLGPAEGWALDLPAMRAAAATADLIWLANPNNPTALPEPDGAIESLLAAITADATTAGRRVPIVVLDEAYAEFVGMSLHPLRARFPNLIVIRTVSKAYALAGMRVGFAIADPAVIGQLNPYRPPGSVSIISVSVATAALRDDTILDRSLARVATERTRLTTALRALGWSVGDSVTNFLLVDFGTPGRAGAAAETLLRHGLVPRAFPSGHPLSHALRLTVRAADENDRLIAAAATLDQETLP